MTTSMEHEGRREDAQKDPLVPVPWIVMSLLLAALIALVTGWFYFMTQDLTLLLFGALAFVPLYLLVLYWVWRDAEEQGMATFLWVVLVLVLFVVGLALYLVTRELKTALASR